MFEWNKHSNVTPESRKWNKHKGMPLSPKPSAESQGNNNKVCTLWENTKGDILYWRHLGGGLIFPLHKNGTNSAWNKQIDAPESNQWNKHKKSAPES